jgi:hypothetical protein
VEEPLVATTTMRSLATVLHELRARSRDGDVWFRQIDLDHRGR